MTASFSQPGPEAVPDPAAYGGTGMTAPDTQPGPAPQPGPAQQPGPASQPGPAQQSGPASQLDADPNIWRVTSTDVSRHFQTRFAMLGWSIASTALAAASLVLFVLTIVSIPLIVVTVGLPLLFGAIQATRPLAALQRRMTAKLLDRAINAPYLRQRSGNLLVRLRDLAADRATWRDAAWLAVNSTIGLAISIVGIVEGALGLIFWFLPPGMMMRVKAYLDASLLSPTEGTTLAQQVQRLTQTRAETRDTSAAELRRIERDLHDGAQARLVSLGMTLGLAEDLLASDPAAAERLLAEARRTSSDALSDLRSLVRGIYPPVLADRGLVDAVRALALAAPIPVRVEGSLASGTAAGTGDAQHSGAGDEYGASGGTADREGARGAPASGGAADAAAARQSAPVESAAYFAIAEGLANAIKHSRATEAIITIDKRPGVLRLAVFDNGRGGAIERPDGGIAGIRRRLAAFDGELTVSSPAGGPTELVMLLPTGDPH